MNIILQRRCAVLALLWVSLVFSVFAKKKEEEPKEPPVTEQMVIEYAKKTLAAKGKEKPDASGFMDKKFETFRDQAFYIDSSSGQVMIIRNVGDWNLVLTFYPEKKFKTNSVLKVSGIIEDIKVYEKDLLSKDTVVVALDVSEKKSIKGRSSRSFYYDFEDFARIAEDYTSLPKDFRDKLPMPTDKVIKKFIRQVSSTNRESRAVNFKDKIGKWRVTLQIKTNKKVSSKSLIEAKGVVIDSISISRSGKHSIGKVMVKSNSIIEVKETKTRTKKKEGTPIGS